jgi:hypothetical protein
VLQQHNSNNALQHAAGDGALRNSTVWPIAKSKMHVRKLWLFLPYLQASTSHPRRFALGLSVLRQCTQLVLLKHAAVLEVKACRHGLRVSCLKQTITTQSLKKIKHGDHVIESVVHFAVR